jgi:hypothetical protein
MAEIILTSEPKREMGMNMMLLLQQFYLGLIRLRHSGPGRRLNQLEKIDPSKARKKPYPSPHGSKQPEQLDHTGARHVAAAAVQRTTTRGGVG